jgi:hypothetical protein
MLFVIYQRTKKFINKIQKLINDKTMFSIQTSLIERSLWILLQEGFDVIWDVERNFFSGRLC